jgi:hypothetical protein
MKALQAGGRYRHPKTGAVMRITEIDEGKVVAWPHPVDLRFVIEEDPAASQAGRTRARYDPGCHGVTTMEDARTWLPIDSIQLLAVHTGLHAYWDGVRWTEVDEKTADDLLAARRVAMSFARVSGYGELNPNITLLVPRDQRRIVEDHHTRWRRAKGLEHSYSVNPP